MYHGRFKGSHYESGFNYGSILKKHGVKIDSCPTFTIDEERINFGKQCLEIYKKYYPEVIEEIQGFADGNETSFEFLSTMLLTMYCYKAPNKCSCFAFSTNDNIIFGRNSDFLVDIEKLYMNCLYMLNNSFSFNGNTTAFIEMEDGMNEHGLAVGLTFIAEHELKPGLNAGMIVRYILEKCKTTAEALEFIRKVPIASAQTFTIADKTGNMIVVECNCEKIHIIKPEKNYVLATNVFVSDKMKKYSVNGFDNWRAEERFQTILNAFNSCKIYDFNYAKDVLSGKYGFICQYDRKTNADTVWSVIYDLKNMKVYRVEGNPSRKPFKLDERLKF